MIVRWPLQITAAILCVWALYNLVTIWQRLPTARPHLAYLLCWLAHGVILYVVMIARVIVASGEPPIAPGFVWWGNVFALHGMGAVGLTGYQVVRSMRSPPLWTY